MCLLIGVLAAVALPTYHHMNRAQKEAQERTEIGTGLDDLQGQLTRDVTEGAAIRVAEDRRLTIVVIRNGVCNIRDYIADLAAKTVSVQTTFFEQESCSGASEATPPQVLLKRVNAARFIYLGGEGKVELTTPVTERRYIGGVRWDVAAEPYVDRDAPDMPLLSSAAFDGRGETTGSGTPELQAKRPLLTLTTAIPGRDAPSMTWTDPTPTLTAGWVVTRAREWEGDKAGAFLAIGWPAATTLSFTDPTLKAGERADFIVYAVLKDGSSGPSSNAITTGLRPLPPASVTATGQPTAITVDWAASPGATGYDVVRDDVVVANVGKVTTWTDSVGYGRTHVYKIIATNRFEQALTTGTEAGRVPLGDPVDKAYTGGQRLVSGSAGAFTAPATPTVTVTPSTSWTDTIAWTPAGWTGAGPTSKTGVARDRGWETEAASLSGAFTTLWAETPGGTTSRVNAARTAGSTTRYRARTCNAVGCSPWSDAVSSLQRPPAPASCTASGASTRGMSVTVNPSAMEATASAYRVTGGAGDPTGTGAQASPSFAIDQLKHSTTHTFAASTQNASPAGGGWSDPVTCQGTTAVLAVAITGNSSTTRTVTASMAVTGGTGSSLTLEGVRTDNNVTAASWDPLSDGTTFTVTARNGDGYNNVAAQQSIATKVLAAPAAPACTVAVNDDQAPGSVTIGGGDQVKLGSSGGATGSPHTYGALSAGTYVGYARRVTSDGHNTSYSGWDGCPSAGIADPYPSPWGGTAPGCPRIGAYVAPTASVTWSIQRASATTCGARWTVTESGASPLEPKGTVRGTGSYTIGSGGTSYSGTAGYAWGPLVW